MGPFGARFGVVGVVQLAEHLVVVQDVAGSSPVIHPGSGPGISMLGPVTSSPARESDRLQNRPRALETLSVWS